MTGQNLFNQRYFALMLVGALALTSPPRGDAQRPAALAPVNVETIAPDVELLRLDAAMRVVEAAGLAGVPVDLATGRAVSLDGHERLVVRKQGLAPYSQTRRGEPLLLGVRPTPRPDNTQQSAAAEAGTASRQNAGDSGIGIRDDGGLIAVRAPRGFTDNYGDTPATDWSLEAADRIPDTRAVASGPLAEPPPIVINEEGEFVTERTPAIEALGPAICVFPIALEPLVDLRPERPERVALESAALHKILQAMLGQFDLDQLPGAIGLAIREAVAQSEARLLRGLSQDAVADKLPFEPIMERVAAVLEVSLTPEHSQRSALLWRAENYGPLTRTRLDRNGNGLLADDIAVWQIHWLQETGLYHPAGDMLVTVAADGRTQAAVPGDKVEADWIEQVDPQVVLGGDNSGGVPAQQGGGNADHPRDKSKQDKSATELPDDQNSGGASEENGSSGGNPTSEPQSPTPIPDGAPIVQAIHVPDELRIPEVRNQWVKEAVERLKVVGLQHRQAGRVFADDKVAEAIPTDGTWVSPVTPVVLNLLRKTPNVVNASATESVRILQDRGFIAAPDAQRDYRGTDIVLQQLPPAGEYLPVSSKIRLTVKRPAPRLVGLPVAQADAIVQQLGFRSELPAEAIPSDIVAEQSPVSSESAPAYADPGQAIHILRVETIVPDLQGASLVSAKTLSDSQRLLSQLRLPFDLVEGQTSYAQAKVLRQSPAPGTRIDRSRSRVSLQMVVPAPNLSSRNSMQQAKDALKAVGLAWVITHADYLPDDFVRAWNVQGASYKTGLVTYCSPRATIELAVGRKVPNVDKKPWDTALATLRQQKLNWTVSEGGSGTHVLRTNPRAGTLIDPAMPVDLLPGVEVTNMRGQQLGQAIGDIQRMGVSHQIGRNSTRETDDREDVGQVFVAGQSPLSGIVPKSASTVVRLDTVTLVLQRVFVPNLTGQDISEAQRLAERSKLHIAPVGATSTIPTPDQSLDGQTQVVQQNLRPGSKAPIDTVVGVTLGHFVYQPSPFEAFATVKRQQYDPQFETLRTVELTFRCSITDPNQGGSWELTISGDPDARGSLRLTGKRRGPTGEVLLFSDGRNGARFEIPADGRGPGFISYGQTQESVVFHSTGGRGGVHRIRERLNGGGPFRPNP